MISARFPAHTIIGEEEGVSQGSSSLNWRLDPVDGTEELVNNMPTWGTIIGLFDGETPIAGGVDFPALDEQVTAILGKGTFFQGKAVSLDGKESESIRFGISPMINFGQRTDLFVSLAANFPNHRIYYSCYTHLAAALGRLDAIVEVRLKDWDLAALEVLVSEAGGVVKYFSEEENTDGMRVRSCAAGKPYAVEQVMKVIADDLSWSS